MSKKICRQTPNFVNIGQIQQKIYVCLWIFCLVSLPWLPALQTQPLFSCCMFTLPITNFPMLTMVTFVTMATLFIMVTSVFRLLMLRTCATFLTLCQRFISHFISGILLSVFNVGYLSIRYITRRMTKATWILIKAIEKIYVILLALYQCFSTAGPRPGTWPWHQLYRAARGLRKLQYATRFH